MYNVRYRSGTYSNKLLNVHLLYTRTPAVCTVYTSTVDSGVAAGKYGQLGLRIAYRYFTILNLLQDKQDVEKNVGP